MPDPTGWRVHSPRYERLSATEEPHEPGVYGRAVADWLGEVLVERGWEVEGSFDEAGRWFVVIWRNGWELRLHLRNREGGTERWALWIEGRRGALQRIFWRSDGGAEARELLAEVDELLRGDAETEVVGRTTGSGVASEA